MKRFISILLVLVMTLSLAACGAKSSVGASAPEAAAPVSAPEPADSGEQVVILYTNDVHCGVKDNVGYSALADMKRSLEAAGNNVLLVDSGDFIQGDLMGAMTNGSAIVDVMNAVGYDVVTIGNHEFDYGMDNLRDLSKAAQYKIVCCNLLDADGNTLFDPYTIVEIGGRKIAFVGVDTPTSITSSTPKYFQDDKGNFIYSFCQGDDGNTVAAVIQSAVDSARAEGAQFVVLLAHLGIEESSSPYTSSELISKLRGVDAVLDGHSHTVMESELVTDADGKNVVLSQTGTKLQNVGMLTISPEGKLKTRLINASDVDGIISAKEKEIEEKTSEVVAHCDYDLVIADPKNGQRIVRLTDTNLSNLVADAFRSANNSDICLLNGGTIRAPISKGDITTGDIFTVMPYFLCMCEIEATGAQILDALEFGVSKLPNEFGGFPQVSGITFTVDMNKDPKIKLDDNGMFVAIEGERRVCDVLVNGEPIDPERVYTVAGTEYMLELQGDGYTMFNGCRESMRGAEYLTVLIDYVTNNLNGEVGEEYSNPYGEGRIKVIEAR